MLELTRLPDWRARFEAEIDAIKHRPFSWEDHECGIGLVGNVVLAVTGHDAAARWRGRYRSYRGAVRVMRNEGFANVADMVAAMLPEIHPGLARIGDIAAFPDDTALGFSLGIVNGERVFVLTETGMGTMDLLQATRAFRVG